MNTDHLDPAPPMPKDYLHHLKSQKVISSEMEYDFILEAGNH